MYKKLFEANICPLLIVSAEELAGSACCTGICKVLAKELAKLVRGMIAVCATFVFELLAVSYPYTNTMPSFASYVDVFTGSCSVVFPWFAIYSFHNKTESLVRWQQCSVCVGRYQ